LEAIKTEEIILQQLNDKKQVCEKLEDDIKLLKSEIEKVKKGSQFENSSRILNEIINSQRSPNTRLVWDTLKTQLLHHKDLSRNQSTTQML
jgi:hypothetical protein